MPVGEITLNGNPYVIVSPVTRQPLIEFSQPTRETTVPKRSDRVHLAAVEFTNLLHGFGCSYDDWLDSLNRFRFNDSTIMTHWRAQQTLSFLNEDSTEPTLASRTLYTPRASALFKGDLWALWDGKVNSPTRGLVAARKYTGSTTTWEGGGTVAELTNSAIPLVALDLAVVGNHQVALLATDLTDSGATASDDHATYRSTNGISWSAATTQPTANLLTGGQSAGGNIDAGKLAVLGLDIYAIIWNEDNNRVDIFKSTDQADVWASDLASAATGSVKGVVSGFPDQNGDTGFVFVTEDGVYVYDTSAKVAHLITRLSSHADNGRGTTIHQGALYVSTGDGGCLRITTPATGIYDVEEMGPNLLDGLPTARQGHFTKLRSWKGFLVGAYGGHAANKNASILLWNTLGWHHLYKDGTANEEIDWIDFSGADDDTERLHFSERTSATAGDTQFIGSALNNPQDGATYKYQTDGELEYPEQPAGMPEVPTAWMVADVDADALTAGSGGSGGSGDEFIEFKYGKTGEAYTANDLGDFLSGTKTLNFQSKTGESTKTILPYVKLDRSTVNTKTPKLRQLILSYLKVPTTRYGFQVTIDLQATEEQHSASVNIENIITNLEVVQDSVTQLEFAYAGQTAVKVKAVPPWDWRHAVGLPQTPSQSGERPGLVTLFFVELIG